MAASAPVVRLETNVKPPKCCFTQFSDHYYLKYGFKESLGFVF